MSLSYNIFMIVLVGASASGKTEVAKKLVSDYGFTKVVTFTTRKKRSGEKNGKDYHFVSESSFQKKINDNFFLEYTKYNDCYYGTSYSEIGVNKVLIVDPNGLKVYRGLNDTSIITFYILGDENIRKQRMMLRGDDPKDIENRLKNDRIQFSYDNIGNVSFVIDGSKATINQLADTIYKKYVTALNPEDITK